MPLSTTNGRKKLDDMVEKGLLIAEERKADNGVDVKYYSLFGTANAAYAYAGSTEEAESGVGGSVEVIDNYIDNFSGNDDSK